jgi:hypothetical protein
MMNQNWFGEWKQITPESFCVAPVQLGVAV